MPKSTTSVSPSSSQLLPLSSSQHRKRSKRQKSVKRSKSLKPSRTPKRKHRLHQSNPTQSKPNQSKSNPKSKTIPLLKSSVNRHLQHISRKIIHLTKPPEIDTKSGKEPNYLHQVIQMLLAAIVLRIITTESIKLGSNIISLLQSLSKRNIGHIAAAAEPQLTDEILHIRSLSEAEDFILKMASNRYTVRTMYMAILVYFIWPHLKELRLSLPQLH